jgi:hypothetical protein
MNPSARLSASSSDLIRLDGELWVRRLTIGCAALVLLVGLADYFLYYLSWSPSEIVGRSFNVGREESLGTWVSTSLSLLAGMLALVIAGRSRSVANPWIGWAIVGLFFVFVSFDDAAKFHERLGTAMRVKVERATEIPLIDWFPSWGWQIYVAPFFAAMGFYIAWFMWRSLPRQLFVFSIVGLGLMGIAVGLDFLEGVIYRQADKIGHLGILAEELLEMFGTVSFIYVLGSMLSRQLTLYVGLAEERSPTSHQAGLLKSVSRLRFERSAEWWVARCRR